MARLSKDDKHRLCKALNDYDDHHSVMGGSILDEPDDEPVIVYKDFYFSDEDALDRLERLITKSMTTNKHNLTTLGGLRASLVEEED